MDTNLLHKYIEGKATEHEQLQVAKWLDADLKHMQQYIELRRIYDALVWVEQDAEELKTKTSKKRLSLQQIGKIAAITLIALLSTYFLIHTNSKDDNRLLTMTMPAGQHGELILADGSRVWLNSQSSIKFPTNFDSHTREVFLVGEAFFDVASDEDHPFIVHTSDMSVRALGTEFNVRSYANSTTSTSLLSGRIDVTVLNTKETYSLSPNEQLKLENETVSLTTIPHISYFEWKNGIISFENETMKTLLKQLSICFNIDITIENDAVLNDTYTGKFKVKEGVEQILKILQLRSNFKYIKEGDHIIIK